MKNKTKIKIYLFPLFHKNSDGLKTLNLFYILTSHTPSPQRIELRENKNKINKQLLADAVVVPEFKACSSYVWSKKLLIKWTHLLCILYYWFFFFCFIIKLLIFLNDIVFFLLLNHSFYVLSNYCIL